MPLVDLPQDILDQLLELLLPPNPSWPFKTDSVPIPVDLHKVMLVCRRLHDLALPWAWRRLAIHMSPYDPYDDEDRFRLENVDDHRLRFPTRFAHVRVFALTFDRVDSMGPTNPVSILTALKSCISLMENLQVLVFGCYGSSPGLVDDIYTSLISQPRLHTLVTSMEAPTVPVSLTSLKRLRVISTGEWFRVAPFLESLSISILRIQDVLTSPVPWSTLRELLVHGVWAVDRITQDFSTWKQTYPETRSPLNEIILQFSSRSTSHESSDCLDRIFSVFRTQDIRTFSLIDLRSVDAELLERIFEAFPGVKSLTLTTRSDFIWNLPSVDVALGRFPLLRELRWNFKDVTLIEKGHNADLDDPDVGPQRFIPSIAAHCKVLEHVKFLNWFVRHRAYSIHRDGTGRYTKCQLVDEERYTVSFSTSSWNPTRYVGI